MSFGAGVLHWVQEIKYFDVFFTYTCIMVTDFMQNQLYENF